MERGTDYTNNTTACMFGAVAIDASVVNSLTREDVCERERSHNNEAAIAIEVVDGRQGSGGDFVVNK